MRFMAVLVAMVLVAGCAPWTPAPVEDRSRDARPRTEPPPEPRSEPRQEQAAPPIYQVRRGETLYSISFRYGMDWRNVARWNNIDAPYTIRPGQELRLTEPPRAARQPVVVARTPETERAPEPAPSPPGQAPAAPPVEVPATRPVPAAESRAPGPAATGAGPSRQVGGVEWQWPTSGQVVRPFDAAATRRGIGIAGSAGQPVYAGAGGEVVYSGTALIGYGELIIIKHSDTHLSAYGHNRRRLVSEGDRVQRGQQIAELGLNDRNEEMLHFEIRRSGQPVNPLEYLPRR